MKPRPQFLGVPWSVSTLRLRQASSRNYFRKLFSTETSNGGFADKRSQLKKTYSFMNLSERMPSSSFPQGGYKSARTAEDAVNNILYNVSKETVSEIRHTLSVFVDNEAGVLSKVSGLLSARGFNIDSLAVANTEVSDLSRMTIVLKGPEEQIEQAKRQLQDLCDVWAVFDHQQDTTVQRELCLVKVSCIPPTIEPSFSQAEEMDSDISHQSSASDSQDLSYDEMMAIHFHRQALQEIADLFEAKVCDIGTETIMLELVSTPARVEGFMKLLRPFNIVEAAKTGALAMAKSRIHTDDDGSKEEEEKVDLASLPPS